MQQFDAVLKLLLRGSAPVAIREFAGVAIKKWLDAEVPRSRTLRADLIGETRDGSLIHIELQSTNDPAMPLRMAEYCLGIYRLFRRFPRQLCLYVGKAPLRMKASLRGAGLLYEYGLIDIGSLDGTPLLDSPHIGDNVIAILTQLRDHKVAVRQTLLKLAGLPAGEREAAMHNLLTLAGLRNLEVFVEREKRKMPVYIDLAENKVLGPAYRKGREEGRQKGRQDGEIAILRRLIEARFGRLPAWAGKRLAAKSTAELEELSVRVLSASSIRELLK